MRVKHLFSKSRWHSVENRQNNTMLAEISKLDKNRILASSIVDLCNYFVETYKVTVPVLLEDEIQADQDEIEIDVSQDQIRHIRDRSKPFYIKGIQIKIIIPFEGETDVFHIQPTSFTLNPPIGVVQNHRLIVIIKGIGLKPDKVRTEIDQTISSINEHLNLLEQDVSSFNEKLYTLAESKINTRKEKLLTDQNLVSALGFPLKLRQDTPNSYITSKIKRKIKPKLPPLSNKLFSPEPALSMEDYNHILTVMENMVHVMERSPSAFTTMNEEALRTHFLVQLNGHYDGKATGETFNYQGKTDILINVENKNVFIAECKFWSGKKKLLDTINQLLSYSSWRDTKVAIIIFNRRKNFTAILDSIKKNTAMHENFKRDLGNLNETSFRYVFSNKDDIDREITLTIMAFNIPSKK